MCVPVYPCRLCGKDIRGDRVDRGEKCSIWRTCYKEYYPQNRTELCKKCAREERHEKEQAQKDHQIGNLRNQLQTANQQVQREKQMRINCHNTHESQQDRLQTQLRNSKQIVSNLENKIKDITAKHASETSSLKKETKDLRESKDRSAKEDGQTIVQLRKEIIDLQISKEEAAITNRTTISKLKKEISDLNDSKANMANEALTIWQLEKEVETLHNKVEIAKGEAEIEQRTVDDLRDEKTALAQEIDAERTSLAKLIKYYESLRSDAKDEEHNIRTLRRTQGHLQEEIEKLQAKIDEQQRKAVMRDPPTPASSSTARPSRNTPLARAWETTSAQTQGPKERFSLEEIRASLPGSFL